MQCFFHLHSFFILVLLQPITHAFKKLTDFTNFQKSTYTFICRRKTQRTIKDLYKRILIIPLTFRNLIIVVRNLFTVFLFFWEVSLLMFSIFCINMMAVLQSERQSGILFNEMQINSQAYLGVIKNYKAMSRQKRIMNNNTAFFGSSLNRTKMSWIIFSLVRLKRHLEIILNVSILLISFPLGPWPQVS